MDNSETRDEESYAVIGAAVEVHRELGCGFLENSHQRAMEFELRTRGIPHRTQIELPMFYKGNALECFYKADFISFETLIVEIKAIKSLTDVDRAQAINYLKAAKYHRALLLNFGCQSLQFERLIKRLSS